jgi:hypothetical protein
MTSRTMEIVTRNSAEIARAIGLTGTDSKEWQVQYELTRRLQQIVRKVYWVQPFRTSPDSD